MTPRSVAFQSDDRVTALVGRLALLVALAVTLLIPLGYLGLEYADEAQDTERQALIKAGVITTLISGNPRLWAYQVQRMEELLEHSPVPIGKYRAIVYDAQETRVASVGDRSDWPVLERSYPLYDSGRIVGRVQLTHSLRPLLYATALTALLALMLGGTVYGVLRTGPLRALRQMRVALEAEQDALRSSEERYRTVADFTYDWEYWLSPDGSLPYVSPSCLRITGYQASEFQHDPGLLSRIVHPEDRQELELHLRAIEIPQNKTDHYELDFRILTREGEERWIAHICQPISDGDGKYLGRRACNRDITGRRRLEAQLRESQKMEALGTLTGGIAHDFNNIVAAIMGNLELARLDVGQQHAAIESLNEIGKASRRARDLVRQILAFGRRQEHLPKVISLAPVVEETARLLHSTLLGGVKLDIECGIDTPMVLADPTQIQQVLLNLCTNAWQAMRGRAQPGTIEVRLHAHQVDEVPASGQERRSADQRILLSPGRYACLMVSDNGPGMDEATRSRMFEPFFTTKPVGEGTGLGLAVVYGIAQAHKASIVVQSEPGQGATFRIYFPAAGAEMPTAAVPPGRQRGDSNAAALVLPGADKHILYIDDDEAIVYLMTRLLQKQGFRVSGYTDALEALAAARDCPSGFDLVVTDYNMPGMSGLEVAQALREIRADLPVAVASGYITEELRARAPAVGLRELLFKPNTVEELCAAVTRLAHEAAGKSKSL